MKGRELVALIWGVPAGSVRWEARGGRLAFAYADSWRARNDAARTIQRVTDLATAVADAVPRVRTMVKASGLQHPIVGRLLDLIAKRTAECLGNLAGR